MKALKKEYEKRKQIIKSRINDFEKLRGAPYSRTFEELCFCLCTPQSKALNADKAITGLKKNGALLKGNASDISKCLKGLVRFHNNKALYIQNARGIDIRGILKNKNDFDVREEIVKNIKGLGFKEASHFLRNIGRAEDLAILDVHILRNLKRLGVIKEVPKTLTRKIYYEIEEKMRVFSEDIKIPLRELDLLFWSRETGCVFK